MEQAVEQHRLESKTFEVKMNKVLNENERLLEQVINKDIVNIIMNSSVDNASVNVHECEKCLKLETELLNKKDFVEKEIYDKLFKSFTTLEKHCISLEVDTQLNQEIFQRDNSVSNQSAPSFDQLFELNELKPQSQEKDTVIKKLKKRIKSLSRKMNQDKIKKDLDEIETINIELDHRVSKLIAENEHLKQTYKQLYDLIKPAPLKDDLRKLKGKALVDNAVMKHTIDPEMLKIDVEPITLKLNTTTTKVPLRKPTVLDNEIHKPVVTLVYSRKPRKSKTNVPTSKYKVLQYVSANKKEPSQSWGSIVSDVPSSSLDEFGSSKYLWSKSEMITCKDIGIWWINHIENVYISRTDNGTEFVNQTLREYYEKVGISHETYVARSLQQNGIVQKRNRMLIEAAHTMLIYAKALLFLWAEAVAIACYTQNCFVICLRHGKTPYELLHEKLPDLSFFHLFGALYYPTNDSENLGKLQPKADIDFDELTAMASEHNSSGPALHEMTPTIINAPSHSNSQTTPETQSLVIPNNVEEDNHDLDIAYMNNNPFFGIPIPENASEASSSDVIPTIVHTATPNSEHVNKWTKDHPLDNIIDELERPISTRLQLHEQALFCYYDAFLTSVEPKNYKDALTQVCWIEAILEELPEFERLEVWKLVPRPDKVMVITLKWIYKVKLNEIGGILKNKARLVARGHCQEEGIDFEKSFAASRANLSYSISSQMLST
ncbi:retrovirus-related pol polyprotein from transposon TNT 1-94 [Tanacetum coccineum]